MAKSLSGKVALVTGGSRGIGAASALALADEGANVAISSVASADKAEAVVTELKAKGVEARAFKADQANAGEVDQLVRHVAKQFGRLDILVNNAGIAFRGSLAETTDHDWDKVIATNLTACFRLSRLAAHQMGKQKWGRIIMISSIMSLIGRPTLSAYAAAKGGLTSLTRSLAAELGPQGITCNAIAPGYIATDLTESLKRRSEFDAYIRGRTPLGRWGNADELAGPAIFLSSEAASYVNGHILTVDGGMAAVL